MYDRLRNTLKASNYSLTKPRRIIFEALQQATPIPIATLAQNCVKDVDRATVYRTVELFEQLGIINRLWHDFKNQIELSEIFTPHHHHAVCQNCGLTMDIMDPELERVLYRTSEQQHFLATSHVIEVRGYCFDCQ